MGRTRAALRALREGVAKGRGRPARESLPLDVVDRRLRAVHLPHACPGPIPDPLVPAGGGAARGVRGRPRGGLRGLRPRGSPRPAAFVRLRGFGPRRQRLRRPPERPAASRLPPDPARRPVRHRRIGRREDLGSRLPVAAGRGRGADRRPGAAVRRRSGGVFQGQPAQAQLHAPGDVAAAGCRLPGESASGGRRRFARCRRLGRGRANGEGGAGHALADCGSGPAGHALRQRLAESARLGVGGVPVETDARRGRVRRAAGAGDPREPGAGSGGGDGAGFRGGRPLSRVVGGRVARRLALPRGANVGCQSSAAGARLAGKLQGRGGSGADPSASSAASGVHGDEAVRQRPADVHVERFASGRESQGA